MLAQKPFSKHSFWYNSSHSALLPVLQTAPPVYKIEDIRIPTAVWSGGEDKFADPKDIARLLPQITNLIYHEHFPTWGHLDFIWGLDATEKMYLKIMEIMKKYFWNHEQSVDCKNLQNFYLAIRVIYGEELNTQTHIMDTCVGFYLFLFISCFPHNLRFSMVLLWLLSSWEVWGT